MFLSFSFVARRLRLCPAVTDSSPAIADGCPVVTDYCLDKPDDCLAICKYSGFLVVSGDCLVIIDYCTASCNDCPASPTVSLLMMAIFLLFRCSKVTYALMGVC